MEEVDNSSAFDFSGNWVFKAYDGTLPSGYEQLCAAGSSNCEGPEADMPIHLARIVGKKYSADSTCSSAAEADTFDPDSDTCGGTTGTENQYMIQVWQSETAKNTCGDRLGFKNEAAKAYARIDFSSSGVTEGDFTWTSGFADGWKDTSNARAVWDMHDCGPVEVTTTDSQTLPGWKCTDSGGNYEINIESGCFDSSDNPIHMTDWSVSPDSCTPASATGLTGFTEDTCVFTNKDPDGSGPLSAMNFTCKHVYGRFDADDSADDSPFFDWNNVASVYNGESSQGAGDGDLCSSVTPSNDFETISQLQCYAEHLWQQDLEDDETKCLRRVEMNWGATDPNEFVLAPNGPQRAMTLFVLAKFEYDSSQSGYFEDEDVYYRGIQTGNSWTNCKVKDHFRMMIKQRSSSVLVGEFLTEVELLDDDKDACRADSESDQSELEIGSSKSMMLLQKAIIGLNIQLLPKKTLLKRVFFYFFVLSFTTTSIVVAK